MASSDGGFAVIGGQIARDGVVIQIILDILENFAEQAVIDELLGQLAQAADFIDIDIEIIWIGVLLLEAITAFAHNDHEAAFLVLVPFFCQLDEAEDIGLVAGQ